MSDNEASSLISLNRFLYSMYFDLRILFTLQIVTAGNGILSSVISVGLKTVTIGIEEYSVYSRSTRNVAAKPDARKAIIQKTLEFTGKFIFALDLY